MLLTGWVGEFLSAAFPFTLSLTLWIQVASGPWRRRPYGCVSSFRVVSMSESVSVLALARLWAHGVGETGQGQRTCPMSKPEKARRSKDDKEERKSVEKEGRKSKRKAERDDPPPQDGEEPEEVKDWRSAEKAVDDKKKEEEIPGAKKYKRGEPNQIGKLKDKKLKLKLQRINDLAKEAANKAALSEILLPSEAGYLEA